MTTLCAHWYKNGAIKFTDSNLGRPPSLRSPEFIFGDEFKTIFVPKRPDLVHIGENSFLGAVVSTAPSPPPEFDLAITPGAIEYTRSDSVHIRAQMIH